MRLILGRHVVSGGAGSFDRCLHGDWRLAAIVVHVGSFVKA
jgi:hypothetical protein